MGIRQTLDNQLIHDLVSYLQPLNAFAVKLDCCLEVWLLSICRITYTMVEEILRDMVTLVIAANTPGISILTDYIL